MATTPRHPAHDLLNDAVRILTAAATLDGPIDIAEFITGAVACAAANTGGIEEFLAGRPGSWEADCIRQLLRNTVGDDPAMLLAYRTQPITFEIWPRDVLEQLDYWQPMDDATMELLRRTLAVAPADDTTPPTEALRDELAHLDQLTDLLDELRDADISAYGEAFAGQLAAAAANLRPHSTLRVDVTVHPGWHPAGAGGEPPATPLERAIWHEARLNTPIPSSGIPLRNYADKGGDIGAQDAAAGRTPFARLNIR